MKSRRAADRAPRKVLTASTSHIVTEAEARQLADQLALPSEVRDHFTWWLLSESEQRHDMEGVRPPTFMQQREELAAMQLCLQRLKQLGFTEHHGREYWRSLVWPLRTEAFGLVLGSR